MLYTEERSFTAEQLERLFLSVDWESGKFPERLKKALDNCGAVFSAWDGEKLVGLANGIDDGEMTAYVHYLLVDPDYQGQGIATRLLELMRKRYRGYHHFFLVAEHKELVGFYEKQGFTEQSDTSVMLFNEHNDE
ncbi:MAG: GNAT family N-acetyltransferase [Oscillospiraceae bacterium]|nr:GNAT family N-acetyltransferase [Oscillospiraceae bacterium]